MHLKMPDSRPEDDNKHWIISELIKQLLGKIKSSKWTARCKASGLLRKWWESKEQAEERRKSSIKVCPSSSDLGPG